MSEQNKIGNYELNKIYLEDCYEAIKNIPDKSIDCIYTDVPYLFIQGGEGKSELGKRAMKKKQELIDSDIENGFDYQILHEFVRVMRKLNVFIWCSKLQLNDIMNFFLPLNVNFELLVWAKNNPQPTVNNTWLPDLEYCLYFREKGVPLNDGYELKSKWYSSPINKKDKDLFKHPTIKPLNLVKRHLLHATQPNDIVADFFIGSGTTAVASRDIGRNFIGFENNAKWHKIAVDRLNGIEASGQTTLFDGTI